MSSSHHPISTTDTVPGLHRVCHPLCACQWLKMVFTFLNCWKQNKTKDYLMTRKMNWNCPQIKFSRDPATLTASRQSHGCFCAKPQSQWRRQRHTAPRSGSPSALHRWRRRATGESSGYRPGLLGPHLLYHIETLWPRASHPSHLCWFLPEAPLWGGRMDGERKRQHGAQHLRKQHSSYHRCLL